MSPRDVLCNESHACMQAHTHVHKHTRAHTHTTTTTTTHTHAHACTHIHTTTTTHTNVHTQQQQTHMHACMHTHTCAHAHTHACTHTHTYTHAHTQPGWPPSQSQADGHWVTVTGGELSFYLLFLGVGVQGLNCLVVNCPMVACPHKLSAVSGQPGTGCWRWGCGRGSCVGPGVLCRHAVQLACLRAAAAVHQGSCKLASVARTWQWLC